MFIGGTATKFPGILFVSGVLWGGAFVAWIKYLTKWKLDLSQWEECKLSFFVLYFFRHYSSSLLVFMSIEKFVALYFPLKSKTVLTVKTAKWVTGVAALIFFSYDVQYLILYKSVKTSGIGNCISINKYHPAFLDKVDSIIYSFGTFTIMFLVNFAIIVKFMKVKCENVMQSSTESTSQALNKYASRRTAMVVTVSITFITLTAPVSIDQVTGRKFTPNPLYYAFMTSMQYLNHSINGVIYCIVGTKFREKLFNIFKCHRKTSGVNYQRSIKGVSAVTM